MECQSYFGFQLPNVRLSERSKKDLTISIPLFIVLCFDLYRSLLVPCCFACNYAFMFCELLCFPFCLIPSLVAERFIYKRHGQLRGYGFHLRLSVYLCFFRTISQTLMQL